MPQREPSLGKPARIITKNAENKLSNIWAEKSGRPTPDSRNKSHDALGGNIRVLLLIAVRLAANQWFLILSMFGPTVREDTLMLLSTKSKRKLSPFNPPDKMR